MWKCSKCGRGFAHRGQWHSCARRPMAEHFKGTKVAAVFRAFYAAVRTCGPVRMSSTKTMITFQARTTFIGLRVQKAAIRGGMLVRGGERRFTLKVVEDVDAALKKRIAEAYRLAT